MHKAGTVQVDTHCESHTATPKKAHVSVGCTVLGQFTRYDVSSACFIHLAWWPYYICSKVIKRGGAVDCEESKLGILTYPEDVAFCQVRWWWLFPCENFGRMFDHSFPACTFFFFLVQISLHTLIPHFTPGLVRSGSASWDDCGWVPWPVACELISA